MSTETTAAHEDVSITVDGGVLRIRLDRPERLNAVTDTILHTIANTLDAAAQNPELRVAVISGAGRAFCSGADIAKNKSRTGEPSPDTIDAANRAVGSIRSFPLPVVAAVNGPAAGVGVSLALACDIAVASSNAYFLLAFTKIGLLPDGGATALVAASIGRARAMRMALMAEKISAEQAASWGLVADVYSEDSFETNVETLVEKIADGPPKAFARTKENINATTLTELDVAFARERVAQLELLGSEDFREGAAAFMERRPARFRGR